MYFISSIFQGAKTFLAVGGTVVSLLIIGYGSAAGGGIVYTIGGSFYLISSLFHLYDSSKVIIDIKKEINNLSYQISFFANENKVLDQNIQELQNAKTVFIENSRKYTETLKEYQKQINKLEEIQKKYTEQHSLLRTSNIELEHKIKELLQIREEYKAENEKLHNLYEKAQFELISLEESRKKYEIENAKLGENNKYLNEQLVKIMELYNSTKKLLGELARIGDSYNEFSHNIDTNIVKLDSSIQSIDVISNQLTNLLTKMREKTFNDFDKNQDGVIDSSEFSSTL